VTMVVDGPQVEAIVLGDDGAASAAPPGTLFVDCSTIGVDAARQIAGRLSSQGHSFIDAPVTGSSPRAEDGTLLIMVGAEESDLARARPVLEAMGSTIVHAGGVGQGQLVKVISNSVSATNAATLAQALLVGASAGADLDALVEVMAGGSAASTMLTLKAGPMRTHNYAPLFKLDHMLKDVRLCLQSAQEAGASFRFAAETEEILAAASSEGFGEEDFAALIEVLEQAAGRRL
jgi:3-hydroxyisobutyrate dehydrogenase